MTAGLVAMLGHGDVIGSPHVTPSHDVTMQFCSGGVMTTPKKYITFPF